MTLARREIKAVHVRINYMLIMLTLAQINNPNNNPVPLIIIINLDLDQLSNVLGVSHASFHLIKKKIHGEGIIDIPILETRQPRHRGINEIARR